MNSEIKDSAIHLQLDLLMFDSLELGNFQISVFNCSMPPLDIAQFIIFQALQKMFFFFIVN